MKILVIEDDPQIAEAIKKCLKSENFISDVSDNGIQGEMLASVNKYDLVITDLNLPQKNGVELCKSLRDKGKKFPILMLTVENEIDKKVMALDCGADDYLSKPFSMRELVARIKALKRRSSDFKNSDDILSYEDLILNKKNRSVLRKGKKITLRAKEFCLLQYFMENPGSVLSRFQILQCVWDMNADPFTNTVDVHVRYLRKKLNEGFEEELIKTVHGIGYKL